MLSDQKFSHTRGDQKPVTIVGKDGKTRPWLHCRKCGCDTWYNPTCGNCEHDLLHDLLEDAIGAEAAGHIQPIGIRLSDVIFKGGLPTPTTTLPPVTFTPPPTLDALVNGGGPSVAGWSISSSALECPYRGQLMAAGVQSTKRWADGDELTHLGYGSLIHVLLAVRWVYGMDWARQLLATYNLHPLDRIKAEHALAIYDEAWPRENEPWYVLGVEVEVYTEIAPGVITSVRYDKVVKPFRRDAQGQYVIGANGWPEGDDHVLSLEAKTSSTGGEGTVGNYTGQFYTQVANWNMNTDLVRQYGPMVGVIGNIITKHKVPRAERIPRYITKLQQQLAVRYLALRSQVLWPVDAEGRLPQMLHACMGRYGPCPYYALCHDDAQNNFETKAQRDRRLAQMESVSRG